MLPRRSPRKAAGCSKPSSLEGRGSRTKKPTEKAKDALTVVKNRKNPAPIPESDVPVRRRGRPPTKRVVATENFTRQDQENVRSEVRSAAAIDRNDLTYLYEEEEPSQLDIVSLIDDDSGDDQIEAVHEHDRTS